MGFGMRLILEPKTEEAILNAPSEICLEELLSSSNTLFFHSTLSSLEISILCVPKRELTKREFEYMLT
jgi:hypothetical protein